jgi:FixJ family two-component response regulator
MQQGTVHIVDDDAPLRLALLRLCRSVGLEAVGHADASELLGGSDLGRPACIVLDVRLDDKNGLDVQETIRSAGCTVPIIFLTGYGTIPMTVRAMRQGAIEFLEKPVDHDAFLDAIGRALATDSAALEERAAFERLSERLRSLTPRELDVMGYAIGGLMNKQIAGEIGVSEITAKVHKRHVMEKMGARSLADLVRIAGQLGITPTRHR